MKIPGTKPKPEPRQPAARIYLVFFRKDVYKASDVYKFKDMVKAGLVVLATGTAACAVFS